MSLVFDALGIRYGIVQGPREVQLVVAPADRRRAEDALATYVEENRGWPPDDEPLPSESPLWGAPNTIITPHVAGYGLGYLERAVELLLANVERLERDEPLRGLVDRERGY